MAESSRRRSRKSTLVPRECIEDFEVRRSDTSDAQELDTVRGILPKIKHQIEKEPAEMNHPNMEFSVNIEVESCDDFEDQTKTSLVLDTEPPHFQLPRFEDFQQLSLALKQMLPCIVDEHDVKNEVLKLMEKTTSQADKILEIELRNTWGRALVTQTVEQSWEDRIVQSALEQWRKWVSQSKAREDILMYICLVCKVGFWTMYPFREHLKAHSGNAKINTLIQKALNECQVMVYEDKGDGACGAIRNDIEIRVEGNCWKCHKGFEAHNNFLKNSPAMYSCSWCKVSVHSTCNALARHEATCLKYLKAHFANTFWSHDDFVCHVCDLKCLTSERYEAHMSTHHAVRSDVPVLWPLLATCKLCQLKCPVPNYHECSAKPQNSRCRYCYRRFHLKMLVDRHENFTKSVSCPVCNKYFEKQCMLISHIWRHSDTYIVVYKCACCPNKILYPTEDKLLRHWGRIHKKKYEKTRHSELVIVPRTIIFDPKTPRLEKEDPNMFQTLRQKEKSNAADGKTINRNYKNNNMLPSSSKSSNSLLREGIHLTSGNHLTSGGNHLTSGSHVTNNNDNRLSNVTSGSEVNIKSEILIDDDDELYGDIIRLDGLINKEALNKSLKRPARETLQTSITQNGVTSPKQNGESSKPYGFDDETLDANIKIRTEVFEVKEEVEDSSLEEGVIGESDDQVEDLDCADDDEIKKELEALEELYRKSTTHTSGLNVFSFLQEELTIKDEPMEADGPGEEDRLMPSAEERARRVDTVVKVEGSPVKGVNGVLSSESDQIVEEQVFDEDDDVIILDDDCVTIDLDPSSPVKIKEENFDTSHVDNDPDKRLVKDHDNHLIIDLESSSPVKIKEEQFVTNYVDNVPGKHITEDHDNHLRIDLNPSSPVKIKEEQFDISHVDKSQEPGTKDHDTRLTIDLDPSSPAKITEEHFYRKKNDGKGKSIGCNDQLVNKSKIKKDNKERIGNKRKTAGTDDSKTGNAVKMRKMTLTPSLSVDTKVDETTNNVKIDDNEDFDTSQTKNHEDKTHVFNSEQLKIVIGTSNFEEVIIKQEPLETNEIKQENRNLKKEDKDRKKVDKLHGSKKRKKLGKNSTHRQNTIKKGDNTRKDVGNGTMEFKSNSECSTANDTSEMDDDNCNADNGDETSKEDLEEDCVSDENYSDAGLKRSKDYKFKSGKQKKKYVCVCGFKAVHRLWSIHKRTCPKRRTYGKRQGPRTISGERDADKLHCTKCDATFVGSHIYTKHFVQHGVDRRACPKCNQIFSTYPVLWRHIKWHVKQSFGKLKLIERSDVCVSSRADGVYRCRECAYRVNKADFFKHWEGHLTFKSTASESKKTEVEVKTEPGASGTAETSGSSGETRTEGAKGQWRPGEHDETVQKAIKQLTEQNDKPLHSRVKTCSVCLRYFKRPNDVKRHLIEHMVPSALAASARSGVLVCQICGHPEGKMDRYKEHMRLHASLPLYKCELCNRAFSDSSNFTKHLKIHNPVWKCKICGGKFQAKASFHKHLEAHRTQEPMECCGKRFYTPAQLRKHVRNAHTQFLRHICNICGQRFRSLKQKWDHQWDEHQQRKQPADCPFCDKSFRMKSDVKRHMRSEHKIKYFKSWKTWNAAKLDEELSFAIAEEGASTASDSGGTDSQGREGS